MSLSLVGLVTLGLTLTLSSSVTLVAENMMPHGPTLLPLYAGIKNHVAVLALKTLRMKVLIHCSDPGRFGLSFFWYYGLFADAAAGSKLPCVTIWAVNPIFIVRGECLPNHAHITGLACKTIWMEDGPCYPDHFSFYFFTTFPTCVHVGHVVLLTEHLVIQLVVGSLNDLITDTANLLCLLKILFTNWFVLKEEV